MISSLELARICGVSQGTVDRALHDRPGVSQETKMRILHAAEEHGYVANPSMRELLSGKSHLVGAVAPSIASPFFMDLMQATANICVDLGLRLLLTPVADEVDFHAALQEFASRRFRGALVVPPHDGVVLSTPSSFRVATFVGRCEGEATRAFLPDEVHTGRDACQYLVGMGHTRIVHVTYGRRSIAIDDRAEGYKQAMREHGLPAHVNVGTADSELARLVTEIRPTAILCHNDWQALDVIRRFGALGIHVPDDISVMGVDDSPTFSSLYPGITTMHYPMAEVARDAAKWLLTGVDPSEVHEATIVEGRTVRDLRV